MIQASSLTAKFQKALDERWGYIWGATGETWTEQKQARATREQTVRYGSQWIGRRVADCSGLFSWAFHELGGYMYHGSNTMYAKYCTNKGELKNGKRSDGRTLKPGTAVFKYNTTDGYYHVGLYVGDNAVIEAKSTQAGVVKSKLSGWTHWGELKGVEYPEETPDSPSKGRDRVLRRRSPMMTGFDVEELQKMLASLGFDPGKIDGKFGVQTEQAVRNFQATHGLTVDGVCGQATMSLLRSLVGGVGVNYIKIVVDAWSVNVRSSPDMSSKDNVVRVVKKGTVLNSVGTDPDTGWYVLDDGTYISDKYVKRM